VDGLVERLALAGNRIGCAERSGGQHAERAGEHGGNVGENVAEEIVGDHDVELFWRADQLHGRVVGQDVVQRDIGIVLADALDHFVPEHA